MKKKFTDYLIVDGYNVINAWSDLNEMAKVDLEGAREKLNFILGEYAAFSGIYTIVVYDAYRVKTHTKREEEIGNLKIVYTKEKQTADSYIEKFITEFGPKKHLSIRVASDDMAEQQMVLGKGGSRITTRELNIEVQRSNTKIKTTTKTKKTEKNTLEDVVDTDVLRKLEEIRKGISKGK